MHIMPVGGPPRSLYSASEILNIPHGRLEFTKVVQRLRRFQRNSVLLIGSRLLWHMWNNQETLKPPSDGWLGNRITQMYAERIISLACIYCSACNRPPMKEVDFRILCWEFYSCANDNPFGLDAANQLEARLNKVDLDSPLKKLDPLLAPFLLGTAFKARVVSEQWNGRHWDRGSLVRSYLIAREFRELGSSGKSYEAAERKFFLTSLEEFYRALWLLYIKASEGSTVELPALSGRLQQHEPGLIQLSDASTDMEEAVLAKLGLANGALRAATNRLSISLSLCNTFRSELEAIEPHWRRYEPQVDLLSRWPILDLEVDGPCRLILVPSPWRLILAFNESVFFGFTDFLTQEGGLDKPATSVRGTAFANYLDKALKEVPDVYNIDSLVELGKEGKRPDFLWLGKDHGVLIEAKFSFRPNSDRRLKDVSAAVATWERAAEPLQQAREFLSMGLPQLPTLLKSPRRWVLAIVTSENLVEEALSFKSIVKAGNLLASTGLDAIALVTPSELEDWVFNYTADLFAQRAVEVYSELDPHSVQQDLLIEIPDGKKLRSPPHVTNAWTELFGHHPDED